MGPGIPRPSELVVIVLGLIANVALLFAMESVASAPVASSEPVVAAAPKAEILGLWKGTSTCTKVEGNEFCHDETIVYNFTDVPSQPATVGLKAARIVDGTMVRSFDLYLTYRPESHDWNCEFDRADARGAWTYAVADDGLTGRATLLPERTVVRNVTAKRTTKDKVLSP
jgi:hypothetical protein